MSKPIKGDVLETILASMPAKRAVNKRGRVLRPVAVLKVTINVRQATVNIGSTGDLGGSFRRASEALREPEEPTTPALTIPVSSVPPASSCQNSNFQCLGDLALAQPQKARLHWPHAT